MMIRFRNPGSNIKTQVSAFTLLYDRLHNQLDFSLKDMERVLTEGAQMTAYGQAGKRATEITSSRGASLNSTLMNAKMYAEVFRLFGWVSPTTHKSSYPLRFTIVGACAATSEEGAFELIKQAMLGYVNPSEINRGVKFTENVRFFPLLLHTLNELGGRMYKHELCLGPMSCSDTEEEAVSKMVEELQNNRGDYQNLVTRFNALCQDLNMKPSSVDNSTRLPIGLLTGVGWAMSGVGDSSIFNKSLKMIELTDQGKAVLQDLENTVDLRLDTYRKLPLHYQSALSRIGVFELLERAGFSIQRFEDQLSEDRKLVTDILEGRSLLFSPYQTIWADEVDKAIGISRGLHTASDLSQHLVQEIKEETGNSLAEQQLIVTLTSDQMKKGAPLTETRTSRFKNEVIRLRSRGKSTEQIVDHIADYHAKDKQMDFYPLVTELFTAIGFPCTESRAGDNGSRWDALVIDEEKSIPLEIKSPTEEVHLSLKAIRQALENKVILLSRRPYPTTEETTTLAVGYMLPNERAEVTKLIDSFYRTYGIRVGVLGIHSLLELAVKAVIHNEYPEKSVIEQLKGILDVDLASS